MVVMMQQRQSICSLKSRACFGASANGSEEHWHSIDFNSALLVDVVLIPESVEVFIEVTIGTIALEAQVGLDDLLSDTLAISLGNPEMSIWEIVGLTLGGVVLIEGSHESIVSLALEPIWGVSLVSVVSTEAVHPVRVWLLLWWLIIVMDQPGVVFGVGLELHVFVIRVRGVR